jgi:hypothetical protein
MGANNERGLTVVNAYQRSAGAKVAVCYPHLISLDGCQQRWQ